MLSAQEKPQEFNPTEVQSLRLQVAQKDAMIARYQLQEAQLKFQTAYGHLLQVCHQVQLDNKWPDNVTCDPDTLAFKQPEKPKK